MNTMVIRVVYIVNEMYVLLKIWLNCLNYNYSNEVQLTLNSFFYFLVLEKFGNTFISKDPRIKGYISREKKFWIYANSETRSLTINCFIKDEK